MVTTVLREYSGLPVQLPKAKRIEKLKSKRHTSHIWISKDGLISIDDRLFNIEDIANIIYENASDPQIVISLKAEKKKMEQISGVHEKLRDADALKLNYSTKTLKLVKNKSITTPIPHNSSDSNTLYNFSYTFLLFPRFLATVEFEKIKQIEIESIDIPQTEQIDNTPPPARPSIPVPSDDEDIAEDLTLDELDFDDFSNLDAPPPPPSGPKVKFIPYDDPPVAITPIRPVYPEIAQEAGIEGVVVVQAFIDKKGRVKETLILKGVPNTGLDEAAMEEYAILFRPANNGKGLWAPGYLSL